jgi:hypothetical protein
MEREIAKAWTQYATARRRLKQRYRGLALEAAHLSAPKLSPPVHLEILHVWALLKLDEAIDLWAPMAFEPGGAKRKRSETFEDWALARLQAQLMRFHGTYADPPELGSATKDSSLGFSLVWSPMRKRYFATEDEATEAARLLAGHASVLRPDGSHLLFIGGVEVPEP